MEVKIKPIKSKKSKNKRKNFYKGNDFVWIEFTVANGIFGLSRRELMKKSKKAILKQYHKNELFDLLDCVGIDINSRAIVKELREQAEKVNKEDIVEFTLHYYENDDSYEEDYDDIEHYSNSENSEEEQFFSLLEGFFLPYEVIENIKYKKINYKEFERLVKGYILSIHPDRGFNNKKRKRK